MRRLPVRARVTLVFALALALVLAGTGLFLYLRFRSGFDYTLNQGLRSRAGDVTALVKQADTGRFYLLEQAWDYDYENRSNVIDVYVRYLRTKIDRPFGTRTIEIVRGTGYRLRPDGG